VAGNLGVPVFSSEWEHDAPVVVLEVSSYQAADLHHVPDVAVLTFLAEDHLSWHGGVEPYVADKLRLLRNESGTAGRILIPAAGGRAAEVTAAAGLHPVVVSPPEAGPDVPRHRLQNAALAAAVLAEVGGPRLDDAAVVDAARGSLPGRLDSCAGPDGVLCIDDALASNPSATAAGLAWLRDLGRPTVVLLGGADRGVDPTPLADEVARWPPGLLRSVTLPDNGADLAARCGLPVAASATGVGDAAHQGLALLPADGVLLFSPAAPTPAGSGNWETRSGEFRTAVRP
jgi:UDP-N-acetylmuramoylalanine--D-glutamate ligase